VKVLVTHPGRQHSHQEALALARFGLLAGYWSGVPSLVAQRGPVPLGLWRRLIRYAPVAIDPALVRWRPATPALRRLGDLLLPDGLARRADFFACRSFDRWVARRLNEAAADAVVACEISARDTFLRARRLGLRAILDAPSIHHAAQDRWHGTADEPGLHRRIVAVKDEEISLADHILTVSEFARETYLDAGVPAEKVHAVPLGADLGLFAPGPGGNEELVFLFAGAAIYRKGFDLLTAAYSRTAAEIPGASLRVVGPQGELSPLAGSSTVLVGPLDQAGLARELAAADCLVLPSRNDSYAMVVAEALACGTPVLVSDHVGARDLVQDGINGWIVPAGDADGLTERMIWCARHPSAVRAMRGACRESVETATWDGYAERFVALLRTLAPARPSPPRPSSPDPPRSTHPGEEGERQGRGDRGVRVR
jgi:glycosyltransferase involved in cell wall biosynthesis